MDGVERIMVLGIFAVIVAILGVAAWSVTQDGGLNDNDLVANGLAVDSRSGRDSNPAGATDGGASAGSGSRATSPRDLTSQGGVGSNDPASTVLPLQRPTRQAQLDAHDLRRNGLIGPPKNQKDGKVVAKGADPTRKSGKPPAPTGNGVSKGTPLVGATPVQPQAGGQPKPKALQAKPPAALPATTQAEVQSGDSLWKLIKRVYKVPASRVQQLTEEIEALNPDVDIDRVFPGQVIIVPNPALLDVKLAQTPPEAMPIERVAEKQPSGFTLYTVREGDTLSSIAREQVGGDVTWQDLYDLNRRGIPDPNDLDLGLTIKLPVKP